METGETWDLIFSDEFNNDGRTFWDGELRVVTATCEEQVFRRYADRVQAMIHIGKLWICITGRRIIWSGELQIRCGRYRRTV
jgi:hypothetical protein